jgi:hypothetical protein
MIDRFIYLFNLKNVDVEKNNYIYVFILYLYPQLKNFYENLK